MGDERPGRAELQRQMDELSARVAEHRADIDELQGRADAANHRADTSEATSVDDRRRIGDLESRADIDAKLIAELQADGLIGHAHEAQLREALHTSRRIGAAIGLLMADRGVSEEEAFEILRTASQNTNRKLRQLADELARSRDVSRLRAF